MKQRLRIVITLPALLLLFGCGAGQQLQTVQEKHSSPLRGVQWQYVPSGERPGVDVPAAGEDARMAYDAKGKRFVFYGGKNDADSTLAETWFYYPAENRWEQLTASRLTPPPREDHVLVYDPLRHKAILHGGEDGDTSNELWELDLATSQWEDRTDDQVPFLEDHSAVYAGAHKGIFVFGGQNENNPILSDIWFLDLDPQSAEFYRWHKVLPEDDKAPSGRVDQAMMYDPKEDRLLIYGGWDKGEDEFTNETWEFRLDEKSWKRLMPRKKRPFPSARRHLGAAFDQKNRRWVIFGGMGEGATLNDIWAFDLDEDTWQNLSPGPAPRLDHVCFYDPESGAVYLYGGDEGNPDTSVKLHDVWKVILDIPGKE